MSITQHQFETRTGSAGEAALDAGRGRSQVCGEPVPGLELQLVTDFAGFEALENDWNGLFERAGHSHQLFQSYNWNWHWCRTYLAAGTEQDTLKLSIVVGKSDGRVVLIWPLITDSNLGVKYACWMGAPVSQYSDVLAEEAPDRDAWLDASWQFICTRLGVDMICVPKVREDAVIAGYLQDLGVQPVLQMRAPCADLSSIGSFDDFQGRFSSRLRKNRRRQRRRLAELGTISTRFLTQGDEACSAVKQAIAMKRCWLRNQGRASKAFADERIDKFFTSLMTSPGRAAGCRTTLLKVGDEVAAVVVGVECKGRYAAHISAYSQMPRFAHSGAGTMAMDASVQNCIEMGFEKFDLMSPGDAYKFEWADAAIDVYDYSVALTPKGHAYAALGTCANLSKDAFNRAPQSVRRRILALSNMLGQPVHSR